MADLYATACAMTYTDLRRRLVKAYQADSADMDPNALGDPLLEEKLSAKLGSYGPVGFRLLLIELSEDLPELHPIARRELCEYACRLRTIWEADQVMEPVEFNNGGYIGPGITVVTNVGSCDYIIPARIKPAA